jgi:hypothetical protein
MDTCRNFVKVFFSMILNRCNHTRVGYIFLVYSKKDVYTNSYVQERKRAHSFEMMIFLCEFDMHIEPIFKLSYACRTCYIELKLKSVMGI